MKKISLENKKSRALGELVLPILIFAAALAIVWAGLSGASGSVEREGLRSAQEAVRRAAVSCYAIEGRYPESYEYLRDNYGLSINEERYAVHYTVFASNIMPEINVVPKGGDR